ncbi:MAG: hypothetical protein H0W15_11760 [Gemmatimonadales bacterium]|nr:hypothetical protein [Gemmatimonadales bacterium]
MIRVVACALLLGGLACAEAPAAPPRPGVLAVDVVSTSVPDGALLFTISGGPVDGVTASAATITTRTDESGTHVLVSGPLAAGALVRVAVPDVAAAPAYLVTLEQVADGRTFVLVDPSSVTLRIRRVP